MVVAGAPSISREYYNKVLGKQQVPIVDNETYALLTHSVAALVTSGTATLETCLLGVPQVVCYKTPVPKLVRFGVNLVLKVKYISLVNLVADAEVVKELFADHFTIYRIINELYRVLPGQPHREEMLQGYRTVADRLGHLIAPDEAARLMVSPPIRLPMRPPVCLPLRIPVRPRLLKKNQRTPRRSMNWSPSRSSTNPLFEPVTGSDGIFTVL